MQNTILYFYIQPIPAIGYFKDKQPPPLIYYAFAVIVSSSQC